MEKLQIGDRVYYTGDMANTSAWCTVETVLFPAEHPRVDLVTDGGRTFRSIWDHHVGRRYSGDGSVRFVTQAAFKPGRKSSWSACRPPRLVTA